MVYRFTSLAGAAILAYAFFELGSLLRPTVDGPPWQFVVVAAAVLGAVLTWTGLTYRMRPILIIALNLVVFVVIAFRVVTPETMSLVLVPTGESLAAMGAELSQALAVIRNGIEPVIPIEGLVVILAAVMWAVGGLTAFGSFTGRPALIVVPGLVLVLQFSTMDRSPTSMGGIAVFLMLVAGAMVAVVTDERRASKGRMTHQSGWSPARRSARGLTGTMVVLTVIGSVAAVTALANAVPVDGMVRWRVSTGLTGEFYGSVSYNPFTDIKTSLVARSQVPLFYARVTGDVPADQVYFRMLTLETYQGGQFFTDRPELDPVDANRWEDGRHAFAGPTGDVVTEIVIDRLRMDWLPAAYTPLGVDGEDGFVGSVRVRRDDGSLRLDGGLTSPELSYQVRSRIPRPDHDVLAAEADGSLSPLFEAAADEGLAVPSPVVVDPRPEPPDVERYLQLPDNIDPEVLALARQRVRGLTTSYEMGLVLESWFRSSDFRYTTDIPPGHGAQALSEWLLDSSHEFYRAGYCETFATSMAVLARAVGIPSRVVLGFTPGEPASEDGIVVVRDRNAHAWVELWIPSQGWVRFDPTPRPDRINPSTTADLAGTLGFDPVALFAEIPVPPLTPVPNPNIFEGDPDIGVTDGVPPVGGPGDGGGWALPGFAQPVTVAILAAALLLAIIPGIKGWRRRRRMSRLRHGDISAAWEQIVAQLTDLGDQPDAAMTPAELARQVDPVMQPLASVYGQSTYGPPGAASPAAVATAEAALHQTSMELSARSSRTRRLMALYSLRSLFGK